jgi:hypothetical protein
MLDREKVVAVLKRRFPGSAAEQIAAAANAIVGLDEEWVEVIPAGQSRDSEANPCRDGCYLRRAAAAGTVVKVFRKQFIE